MLLYGMKKNTSQSGKVALITGSYGALGSCFATIHAARGGDLVLVGRDAAKLEEQAVLLRDTYAVKVNTIAADLSIEENCKNVYTACKSAGVNVDYLINNAGFGGWGDFIARPLDSDISMIDVNIKALVTLCKLFIADFVARGSGRVLNVSSTAAFMAGPLQSVYFATKAFVTSFSNALYRELKGSGVTVTTLMPGAMNTPFIEKGKLIGTKLFAVKTRSDPVALAAYNAMLRGKIDIIAGLLWWQKPLIKMVPLLPKSLTLNIIYKMQQIDK